MYKPNNSKNKYKKNNSFYYSLTKKTKKTHKKYRPMSELKR